MNELEPITKIGRRNNAKGSTKGERKPVAGSKSSSVNVDKVTLSGSSKAQAPASTSKSKAGEIRYELVNKFRDILQNESYEVKANEIADKIVQKIRENKNNLIL